MTRHLKRFICRSLGLLLVLMSTLSADLQRSTPFVIAPMIEGAFRAPDSFLPANAKANFWEHEERMLESKQSNITAIENVLKDLQPGQGGKVKIGYTLPIDILALYHKEDGTWKIDPRRLQAIYDIIANIDRPVVLYVMANHFSSDSPLVKELHADQGNLQLLPNNKVLADSYAEHAIVPFTLSLDESIPANRYRFEALRALAKFYKALPDSIRARVVAFTLGGEIHQLFLGFGDITGAGKFQNISVTDYAPRSVEAFQTFLAGRYQNIHKLNAAWDAHFDSFAEIQAPSKNIRTDQLRTYFEHYDSYAGGTVPVFGWMWDPKGQIQGIEIWLDGSLRGEAVLGLSRNDVYEAVPEINTPNLGYRYVLDFSAERPGIHIMDLVVRTANKRIRLSKTELCVIDRRQNQPQPIIPKYETVLLDEELKDVRVCLDHPKPLQDLYFNPLAKDWNEFRAQQVDGFICNLFHILRDAGIPRDLLFSHQITPKLNGSWNEELFSAQLTLRPEAPYNPGMTLYGGASTPALLEQQLKPHPLGRVGITEFHTQQPKRPEAAYEALRYLYEKGARFVCPYYMSAAPREVLENPAYIKSKLNHFLICKTNESYGSNFLYEAIRKMADEK